MRLHVDKSSPIPTALTRAYSTGLFACFFVSGAIYSRISDVSIDGDCTFVGNTAGLSSGGEM